MKVFIRVPAVLVLIFVLVPLIESVSVYYPDNSAAKICQIRTKGCNRQNVICAAKGQNQTCMKFRNRCQMNLQNCQETNGKYNVVNNSYCRNFVVGVAQACTSTNSNNGGFNGGLNGGLNGVSNWANFPLGGSATNSNVKPIIIRV